MNAHLFVIHSLPLLFSALIGLIFAIISSQQNLRRTFPNDATLLDFAYMATYFLVLLIALAGFLYFIEHRLLEPRLFWPVKLAYWPLVTAILLVTTLTIYLMRLNTYL